MGEVPQGEETKEEGEEVKGQRASAGGSSC